MHFSCIQHFGLFVTFSMFISLMFSCFLELWKCSASCCGFFFLLVFFFLLLCVADCTLFLFVLLVFLFVLVFNFSHSEFMYFLFVLWWQCCVSRGSHGISGWSFCVLLISIQPEGRGPIDGLIWMYEKFWVRWHLMSSRDHFLPLVFPLLDVCYFGSLFTSFLSFTSLLCLLTFMLCLASFCSPFFSFRVSSVHLFYFF